MYAKPSEKISDNDKIIRCLSRFKIFDIPVLVGLSRKSFLSIDNDKPIYQKNMVPTMPII